MDYVDARCASCGSWRTALVGYGGSLVCLACGAEIAPNRPGGDPGSLARFSAGPVLDELWARPADPGAGPGPGPRKERLRGWLQGQSITLPDAYVEALAHCERASEVRFALPIVTLSTWRPVGERSFSDGRWTLRLQHPVLGRRVDFLLEGPGPSRGVVVEIGGTGSADDASLGRAELRFALELQAARYPLLRVPAHLAEERGNGLRGAFMREALGILERAPPAPAPGERRGTETRRMWSRHGLVYDAGGLPREERRALVEDWLRSRGERPGGWQLDFLANCDRAAEVHFALPFLRLTGAEPVDPCTVHLDASHTLTAQRLVDDYPVDFALLSVQPRDAGVTTTLVEIHPARGPRDREAERRRARQWTSEGHRVVELEAAEAGDRGRVWAASLLGEPRDRAVRDAG